LQFRNLTVYPILYDQGDLLRCHAGLVTEADLDLQHIQYRLDGGKIGLGTGKSTILPEMEKDELIQMFQLPGQVDDLLKGHPDRYIGTFLIEVPHGNIIARCANRFIAGVVHGKISRSG